MKARHLCAALTLYCSALIAADYQSPYKVEFTFKETDLIGDLLQGPRGNWYASKACDALRIIPEGK